MQKANGFAAEAFRLWAGASLDVQCMFAMNPSIVATTWGAVENKDK